MVADTAGNAYMLTPDMLYCYHAESGTLDSMAWLFGRASQATIDVRMPDSVMVFYPSESVVQFVSPRLKGLTPPVRLQQYGFDPQTLLCTSQNGGFWLYDYAHDRLLHTDAENKVLPLRQLFLTIGKPTFEPCFMQEYGGRLYLGNFEDGVLVFSPEGGMR